MGLFRRDLPFSTMQMAETYAGNQGGWGPGGDWVSLALCDLGKAPRSPGPGLLLGTMWGEVTGMAVRFGEEQESAWFSVFKVAQAEAEMATWQQQGRPRGMPEPGTLGSRRQYLGPET